MSIASQYGADPVSAYMNYLSATGQQPPQMPYFDRFGRVAEYDENDYSNFLESNARQWWDSNQGDPSVYAGPNITPMLTPQAAPSGEGGDGGYADQAFSEGMTQYQDVMKAASEQTGMPYGSLVPVTNTSGIRDTSQDIIVNVDGNNYRVTTPDAFANQGGFDIGPLLLQGAMGAITGSAFAGVGTGTPLSLGYGPVVDYGLRGALQSALSGRDPLTGAITSIGTGGLAESISPAVKDVLNSFGITDPTAQRAVIAGITSGAKGAVLGDDDPLKRALQTALGTAIPGIASQLFPAPVVDATYSPVETATQAAAPVEEAPYTPADIQPITKTYDEQYASGETSRTDISDRNWKKVGEGITKEQLEQYASDPNSGIVKDENGYFIVYGKSVVTPDGQYVTEIGELPVSSGVAIGEGNKPPISTGQSIFGSGYGTFISPENLGGFSVVAKDSQSTVLINPKGFTLISYANGAQQLFDNNQVVIPIEELPRESQQEIQKIASQLTGSEPASSATQGGWVSGESLPTGELSSQERTPYFQEQLLYTSGDTSPSSPTTQTEQPTVDIQQPSQSVAGEVAPTVPAFPSEPVLVSETGNYEIPIFNPYAPPSSATQPATPGVPVGEATTYGTTGQEYAPYVSPAAGIPNQQDVAAPSQPSEEPYSPGVIGDITYAPAGDGGAVDTFDSSSEMGLGGQGSVGDMAGVDYGYVGGADGQGVYGDGYGYSEPLTELTPETMPVPEPGETNQPASEETQASVDSGGLSLPSVSLPGYTSPPRRYAVSPATTAYLARGAISTPEITGSPVFGTEKGKRRKVWNIESLREALGV